MIEILFLILEMRDVHCSFLFPLGRRRDTQFLHKHVSPIAAAFNDKIITLTRRNSLSLLLILHLLQLSTDVHLNQLLPAFQSQSRPPVVELDIIVGHILPDEFVEVFAAGVDRAQVVVRELIDALLDEFKQVMDVGDGCFGIFLDDEGLDGHGDVVVCSFDDQWF